MITKSKNINRTWLRLLCLCLAMCMLVGMLPATVQAATPSKLYLKPNSNWTKDGARFAAYFFGNGEKWVSMTKSAATGIYEVSVPAGFPYVIFCRMYPGNTANNWNNKWNQTGDLKIPTDGKDLFTVPAGAWDVSTSVWSVLADCAVKGHNFVSNKCSVCDVPICDINGHNYTSGDTCSVCSAQRYMNIYFRNEWFWSDVRIHFWGTKSDMGTEYPGVLMTDHGNDGAYDYYVMKVPTDITGLLFYGIKDDGSGNFDKSPDVNSGWHDGIGYYMHWDNGNKVGSFDISGIQFVCKHTNQTTVTGTDATCTEDGLTDGIKCTDCGETLQKQETIPAKGHSYKSEVSAPDCENGGYTTYTCSACGDTYTDNATDALGHDWDDATCTAPKTCSVCGETEGEALGHEWDDATCTAAKTCSVCGETEGEALGHEWDDATCTAPKTCSVCGETEGEALGHDWDDATCTAPKTCSVCGETEGSVIDHNDQDNNGRCDYCSCLMQDAKLSMASISLKGNIAINYYMLLSDEALADKTAYMQFTLADGEIRQIPVSEGVKHEYYGEIYYVFTCAVDAKEMTDDVLSQFFYAGGSSKEYTYSVQTYADYILTNSSNTKMKALVAAMLNYGAASQIHFNYRTDDLANAGLEAPDYANVNITGFGAVSGQGTELAKLYSASLILKSETTLRFFFRVEGSATLTVTYNGQPLEVMERSGLYYVDIVGISAKDMSESVTVTISDGTSTTEVFFNPMSYCQGVLNDKTGAFGSEMKNLVCALYLYNQAANSYFGEG